MEERGLKRDYSNLPALAVNPQTDQTYLKRERFGKFFFSGVFAHHVSGLILPAQDYRRQIKTARLKVLSLIHI